jgi:hypothetical protein
MYNKGTFYLNSPLFFYSLAVHFQVYILGFTSLELIHLFLARQAQWQLIRRPCACTPRSIFFTTGIVRNNECGQRVVSRRHAAEDPWYSAARRNPSGPAVKNARALLLWEKQCNCFGLMWTAAACPLEHHCRGTRFRGSTRPRTRLSSLLFAPSLIHSRSIIPKAETHHVYLRDALIYPDRVPPTLAFVSRFHLSPDQSAWRAGVVAALIISVISTASVRHRGG